MNTIRLLLFTLLLALGNIKAIAQCAENIRMYELGLQLFEEGKYLEAAETFAVVDSLDKLDFDENDNRKGSGNHWQAYCLYLSDDIEKAKSVREGDYDILPVDRKLMYVPDSIFNLGGALFYSGRFDEAESLFCQGIDYIRSRKLTKYISYFYGLINRAQIVAAAGKMDRFVIMADSILAEFDNVYPNHPRNRKYILKYILDTAIGNNDVAISRRYYEQVIGFLRDTNQYEDQFTIDVICSYVNFLLNHGDFLVADGLVDEMLRLTEILYGKESPQYFDVIVQMINNNVRLKRWEVAKKYIDSAEILVSSLKGEKRTEYFMRLQLLKAVYCTNIGEMEEARRCVRWVYKHADYRTEYGKECLSVAIPLISGLKSLQGKVDKELVEEMTQMYNRMKDDVSDGAKSIKGMLMAAFFGTRCFPKAVQIADELSTTFPDDVQMSFYTMYVYLGSGEYIKARKVGHKSLEGLNERLGHEKLVSTALAYESEIDKVLETLRVLSNQHVHTLSPDTTNYALNLLKQDFLHAKLRILEQKDSIGSEAFMSTLESFYFLARNDNYDFVIADSIKNEYSKKLSYIYDADSEQMKAIASLEERGEFESTDIVTGAVLRCYKKGSELYNNALEEYNKKFAEWKQKRDNRLKEEQAPKETVPNIPYVWAINQVTNTDSLFNEVWKALAYFEINGKHSELMYRADTWCYIAQKANRIDSLTCFTKRILPKIGDSDKQKLMGYVWLYAGESAFDECLQLIFNGVHDSEVELGCLLHSISEYEFYCKKEVELKPIMNRIQLIIDRFKQSTDKNDKIRYYAALVYTNLVRWRHSNKWNIDKNILKEDFVRMYHEIGQEKSIWKYSAFNKALDVTCLLLDYADGDSIAVDIHKTRRCAQHEASEAGENTIDLSWMYLLFHHGYKVGLYEGVAFPGSMIAPCIEVSDEEIDDVYRIVYMSYFHQQKYERDYEFYKYWVDYMKKRYSSNEETLSKHIEKLLGDIVWSCHIMRNKDEKLNGLAYDLAIWNKGYLLRSDQQVAKVLLESGNKTIAGRYEEYISLKQRMSDSKNDEKQSSSLQQQAEAIWNEMKSKSKTFEDYTKHLDASWKDVQTCLGENDMAIEFVSTHMGYYYALLLKKDYSCPLIEELGYRDNTVKEKGDSIYTKYLSYESPWPYHIYNTETYTSLFPFEGIKNVYFSPAGSLNKISIENMKAEINSDSLMSEKYRMYRLSNTRDLLSKKNRTSNGKKSKSVLFGGINYDLSQDQWAEMSLSKQTAELFALRSREDEGRGAQNISLNYLRGTKTEVDAISSVLKSNRINHMSFTGNEATEDMFKSLSNQGVTSLHIATHGFYSSDTDKKDGENFRQAGEINEDKSMMQNGLYFAGANSNFYGEDIPVNVNDGILSAQEVSYLDFTDCDLVTLSACETGLGEVSGEGVFGLQRGFKKAGVNSILMSLWKVDDEATCKLMTEFYSNWIAKKMTKHDALEAAKKVVRETKGWEDPKYWAAFILLDGLD